MGKKEKIAILGGGMASLVTAFSLTEQPDWRERYEITVYQTGWRLGGKGASSRNAHAHHRIEEHGLHVFYGFYENTFRLIRRCYEELGRSPDQPLATWRDAFTPHHFITLQEQVAGEWNPWFLPFPPNTKEPGDSSPLPTLWQCLSQAMEYGASVFDYWHFGIMPETSTSFTASLRKHTQRLLRQCLTIWQEPDATRKEKAVGILQCVALRTMQGTLQGLAYPDMVPSPVDTVFLRLAKLLMEQLTEERHGKSAVLIDMLVNFLRRQRDQRHKLDRTPQAGSQRLRRMLICEDLFLTVIIGLIEDGLVGEHLDWRKLDDEDLKAWLQRHGAHTTTTHSTLVNALYDAAFSRDFGVAAGTMLHAMIRMFCTYKGAFMWKMNAGMGETIFTPLYLVLKRRGVKFQFFHRVDHIDVGNGPQGKHITRIMIGRQATWRDPSQEYQPLIRVNGLECWPAEPDFSQLNEGSQLQQESVDLENAWTSWVDPVDPLVLEVGKDFDRVVLGISVAALPWSCGALIADHPRWAAMMENVATTQTQAVQLWYRPSLPSKGWSKPPPILIQFADPFDTWADMTHLLPTEGSPIGHPVGSIAYLCARLQDQEPVPHRETNDYPQRQQERVREHGLFWLSQYAHHLWPHLAGERRWEQLIDPENRESMRRFEAQYWHAPKHPSDRYVVAPAGSTRYRLHPDESGYHNLFLAGDWVATSMNLGCVEAATMAGLAAAQALSGHPVDIYGDWLAKLR